MTVGPDYEPPAVLLPDAWTMSIQADNNSAITGAQRWWRKFNDPTLNKLITQSREANPNINIAKARITESWHQRSVLAAAWYPHSDFSGRDNYGIADYDRGGINWGRSDTIDQYAAIDAGWELDIFGKIKRQVESAEAEYEAKIEGLRDATVFINGEVALHYIAYRTLEQRLNVAREGVANYRNINNMIETLREEGLANDIDVHETSARLKTTEAEIPRLEEEKTVVRNRLAALLAIAPGDIQSWLAKHQKIPTPPSSIATGFPAELLRSRPDVRRAERKIASHSALIGVATASLYPELSISGAIKFEYLREAGVLSTFDRLIGLGPSLKWRLFHGCADRSRIKEFESKFDQAIMIYNSTIIEAITQVENSMARIHYTKKRLSILEKATDDYQKASSLMVEAYQAGEVDLKRLLNSQDDFIRTKDEMIATKGRRAAHSVRLFKALGGGELPPPKPVTKEDTQLAKKAKTN